MSISKILKILYLIILIFGLNFNYIQADEHNSLDDEEFQRLIPFKEAQDLQADKHKQDKVKFHNQ